ncbi:MULTISPECIES: SPOR domain-containing protein [unclassified Leeuwenhoekiella]|uniref:HU domain-containing protein n=1 Tax=unclassified Leeuwenhoekiella TaxID=2615029 RepID=UPI000C63F6BB|nr:MULTISPECIES: SPOR domain-containing protein [unclassified Leeuwenhoekiella]MBA80045.1 sporulation protein [Leeuwenhoekiella sp.]|tara:strand:- start:44164 stop:45093 length:930 start_codon:yes stop_codon:yes gene_type:complete
MHFTTYISDLLYRYECVIIPGFGAFLGHRVAARHNPDTHTFFPPYKRLSFNAQLTQNDGLLANYAASAENISYGEALQNVQEFAAQLNADLQAGNEVVFTKIGTLSRNEAGKINFEPAGESNFLTEAFGLATYQFEVVSRTAPVVEEPVVEPKVVTLEQKQRNSPWLKYAAVGLLAIGLSGSLGFLYFKDIADHNLAEEQKAKQVVDETIQKATFTIENPLPAVTLNVFKPSGNYHIVAGAFRIPENAEVKVEELRKAGYKARLIGENKYGLHQVVYGSYADRSEASKVLREVRNSDNPNAWMLVQELD